MPAALASPAPRKLSVENNENLPLSDQLWQSRSPHPYHRSKADAPNTAQANGQSIPLEFSSNHTTVVYNGTAFFDADRRKRRKLSTSPSDSGTEADDESSGLLRGLPAPPVRPRKGLKETRLGGIEHTPSPLLTPSYLDEDRQKGSLQCSQKRQESPRNLPGIDDEIRHFRLKLARRRRAEIFRRVVETALLGLLGIVVLTNDKVIIAAKQWDRGMTPFQSVTLGCADSCLCSARASEPSVNCVCPTGPISRTTSLPHTKPHNRRSQGIPRSILDTCIFRSGSCSVPRSPARLYRPIFDAGWTTYPNPESRTEHFLYPISVDPIPRQSPWIWLNALDTFFDTIGCVRESGCERACALGTFHTQAS